jgi:hypothetical protein
MASANSQPPAPPPTITTRKIGDEEGGEVEEIFWTIFVQRDENRSMGLTGVMLRDEIEFHSTQSILGTMPISIDT